METRLENNGKTALMLACQYGHFELMQFLLSVHVDVNAADNKWIHSTVSLFAQSPHQSADDFASLASG